MDVYKVTHRDSGKCYVGATIRTAEVRFREHCGNAMRGERVSPLYDAMRFYGPSSFEVETITTAKLYEELLELEREAIAHANSVIPYGYNVVRGGRGNLGWSMPKATRAKISARAKGRPAHNKGKHPDDATRERIRIAQLARFKREQEQGHVRVAWNKGIPHSEETRKKMSASHAGYRWTSAHRAACEGKTLSETHKMRIAQSQRERHARRMATLLAGK